MKPNTAALRFKTRANKISSIYHVSVNRDMFDV